MLQANMAFIAVSPESHLKLAKGARALYYVKRGKVYLNTALPWPDLPELSVYVEGVVNMFPGGEVELTADVDRLLFGLMRSLFGGVWYYIDTCETDLGIYAVLSMSFIRIRIRQWHPLEDGIKRGVGIPILTQIFDLDSTDLDQLKAMLASASVPA